MILPFLLSFAVLAFAPAAVADSAPRLWRNAAGTSSFEGTFLSREGTQVSIRRVDGTEFELELGALHADDRHWVENRSKPPSAPAPPAHAVFDTLCFGDSRQQVEDKLKESAMVELAVKENFLGRMGLNDSFKTRKDIGGLRCLLAFDWSPAGKLREVTLHTDALEPASYNGRLKDTWKELAKLMTTLHGKPLQAADYPKSKQLQDGMFLSSHLWRLPGGGSALLGPSRKGDKFAMAVRFTTEKIEPVRIP